MKSKKKSVTGLFSHILHSKVCLFCSGALFVILLIFFVKDIVQSRDITQEIDKLEEKVVGLEVDKQRLHNTINYLNSEQYIETEAKSKLGLQKQGESVIIISDDDIDSMAYTRSTSSQESDNHQDNIVDDSQDMKESNHILWFRYFFKQS